MAVMNDPILICTLPSPPLCCCHMLRSTIKFLGCIAPLGQPSDCDAPPDDRMKQLQGQVDGYLTLLAWATCPGSLGARTRKHHVFVFKDFSLLSLRKQGL